MVGKSILSELPSATTKQSQFNLLQCCQTTKNPVVGKNKWFFERKIFCCEKILDLINSYFGSLVTLEKGT